MATEQETSEIRKVENGEAEEKKPIEVIVVVTRELDELQSSEEAMKNGAVETEAEAGKINDVENGAIDDANVGKIDKENISETNGANVGEIDQEKRNEIETVNVGEIDKEKVREIEVKASPNSNSIGAHPGEEQQIGETSESMEPSTASKTSTPIATSTAVASSSKPSEMCHHVKWIHWSWSTSASSGSMTPIVTQSENGPCPLLALANVLFLRGQAQLDADVKTVSSQQLLNILHDCIKLMKPEQLSSHNEADYQRNVDDALASLPKLLHGIDVNVKFTGVDQFEYTPDLLVFDLLNIPLCHGWLVEPEVGPVADTVNQYSYNQLVEFIIAAKSGSDQGIASASLAEDFLETTASQLTYRGLCELNSTLKDGALCVFFRNNHFSTLLKHKDELFLLVTDQGFLNEPRVLWESLNSLDGDSRFVDVEFRTVPPKPAPVPVIDGAVPLPANASPQEQLDHDLMVALTLEEQERAAMNEEIVDDACNMNGAENPEERDRRLALKLQEEEDKLAAQQHRQGSPAAAAAATDHQNSPTGGRAGGKKDKCTII